jgi:hygromycin-B 4-O-kinase
MDSVRPDVADSEIISLLKDSFDHQIEELTSIQEGLVEQTFSFRVDGDLYNLRLITSSIEVSYQKEAFISRNFSSPSIPIPPVIKFGQIGDIYYLISKKLPGRSLGSISPTEYEEALPDIIQTLFAIHQSDVSKWQGYGWIDDDGRGMYPSWKSFIAKIIEEERSDGFYGKWHHMFQTTFLERDFFETVYKYMVRLLDFCPEKRFLVHGMYGYNNILVQSGKVLAVLNWVDSTYGDFVYDIAWIDFWAHNSGLPEFFLEYYSSKGINILNFQERISCYKCYIGLDALRFFAKTNNPDTYGAAYRILQNLLTSK